METRDLFSQIAPKYDRLNHLLSLGIDRRWRRALVDHAEVGVGEKVRILDLCTGTGDIAIEFARRAPAGEIVGVDLSGRMLEIARQKLDRLGLQRRIALQEADCLDLPFEDGTFDIATIGFGLRNLANYERGIAEMARVLKDGGRLLILEFSLPPVVLLSRIYRFYLTRIIPLIGGVVAGERRAYEYLASSIQGFLKREEVLALMRSNELEKLYSKELTGGIASLYRGVKLPVCRSQVPGLQVQKTRNAF